MKITKIHIGQESRLAKILNVLGVLLNVFKFCFYPIKIRE